MLYANNIVSDILQKASKSFKNQHFCPHIGLWPLYIDLNFDIKVPFFVKSIRKAILLYSSVVHMCYEYWYMVVKRAPPPLNLINVKIYSLELCDFSYYESIYILLFWSFSINRRVSKPTFKWMYWDQGKNVLLDY